MKTHLTKWKMECGNKVFRGQSNSTKHRFLQTGETVPLREDSYSSKLYFKKCKWVLLWRKIIKIKKKFKSNLLKSKCKTDLQHCFPLSAIETFKIKSKYFLIISKFTDWWAVRPTTASSAQLQAVATIVAHEISHQWYATYVYRTS